MRNWPCLLLLLGLTACQDLLELEGTNAEGRYALPLVDSRATIEEFLEVVIDTGFVEVGPEGQLTLVYRRLVFEQSSRGLFEAVEDLLPITLPVLSDRQRIPFALPGLIEPDRMDLSGGQIGYVFQWVEPKAASVTIRVPQVVREGVPLQFTHELPPAGPGDPYSVTNLLGNSQLEGYQVLPEDGGVFIEYELQLADGSFASLTNFLFSIQSLDFSYVEGFFGTQAFEGPSGSIPFDLYENWDLGAIYLEEPRAFMRVENSIGLPVEARISTFEVFSVDGRVVPLESELVRTGVDVPFPGPEQVGETVRDTFVVDGSNSNFPDIIAAQPSRVDYAFDAFVNPGNDPDLRGFFTSDSRFRADLELELPLYGSVSDFVTRDTIAIDFTQFEQVDYGEFKFTSDNELPLEVQLQVYFLDPGDMVVDSLFESPEVLLRNAPVNEQGISTTSVRETFVHLLEAEDFSTLLPADRLVIALQFRSPEDGRSVRVLSGQAVRIRLGAILGLANE